MSRKILITGTGSGFGEGAAIGLAQKGHDVIATVQISAQVNALRKKAETLGIVSDVIWPEPIYPWVITSLGTPLRWRCLESGVVDTTMTMVLDDSDLEPLHDDNDGLTRSTAKDKPIKKPRSAEFQR